MAQDDRETAPVPALPGGIGEAEFNNWKHHPVTRCYLQMLLDWRETELLQVIQAWEAGRITLAGSDEARGLRNGLLIAANPDFETAIEFYERRRAQIEQEKAKEVYGDEFTTDDDRE